MFDIMFISTIFAAMYISWYAYTSPSGVSLKIHTLAITSAAWLLLFFAYYMVAEASQRPGYHTALVYAYYGVLASTYATLYYRGCIEERNKLRDNKSR